MKHSDSLVKIAPALVACQGELRTIAKDHTNPHFKNKYASLDSIIETIRPTLAKHGLAVVQGATTPDRNEAGAIVCFSVETMLLHTSGEWISAAAIVPLQKQDAQGAGGALTYGRRYSLSSLLTLATDEDDDGTAAVRKSAPAARPVQAQAPARASKEQIDRLHFLATDDRLAEVTVTTLGKALSNGLTAEKADEWIKKIETHLANHPARPTKSVKATA